VSTKVECGYWCEPAAPPGAIYSMRLQIAMLRLLAVAGTAVSCSESGLCIWMSVLPHGCGNAEHESMSNERIPPMAPLAPIVDRMRDLAVDEIPSPRTCKVHLWDDDTFNVVIYHSRGEEDTIRLHYERTTGEIIWEHIQGGSWTPSSVTDTESLYEPACGQVQVRLLETVTPPYEDIRPR